MKRTIHLHGRLRDQFPEQVRLDVDTPAEAIRALTSNFKGFRDALCQGQFRLVRGALVPDHDLSLDLVSLPFGQATDLHIVPVLEGAGGQTGKIVLGVALVAVAAYSGGAFAAAEGSAGLGATAFSVAGAAVTWGNIAAIGGLMALGGISGLLAGTPRRKTASSSSDESFLLNIPQNKVQEGCAVPLVYGRRVRVGSVVVSAGLQTEIL
jgi:predicted phage tail protein